jgi:hypothetical protein
LVTLGTLALLLLFLLLSFFLNLFHELCAKIFWHLKGCCATFFLIHQFGRRFFVFEMVVLDCLADAFFL